MERGPPAPPTRPRALMTGMARVAGIFFFRIPGLGLWLDGTARGSSVQAHFRGRDVKLDFPERNGDFGLKHAPPEEQRALGGSATTSTRSAVSALVVRATAYCDAPFGSADFADQTKAPVQEGIQIFAELLHIAGSFVADFVGRVRTSLGHYWMGTSTDPPELIWDTQLIDTETNERIPLSAGGSLTGHVRSVETSITSAMAQAVADAVARGTDKPLAEELIADARYLAFIRKPPDLRIAVLFAAIACEAKIKQVLGEIACSEARSVLDIILGNPRDVTVAVVTHLDKTALAVAGRSLRNENQELWRRAEKLFSLRNALAHGKRAQPSEPDMHEAVKTAVAVFEWIGTLSAGVPTPPTATDGSPRST